MYTITTLVCMYLTLSLQLYIIPDIFDSESCTTLYIRFSLPTKNVHNLTYLFQNQIKKKNALKELFTISSFTSQQIRMSQRILNKQVSCKMALYLECTTCSSECTSVGFQQSLLPHYQKAHTYISMQYILHSYIKPIYRVFFDSAESTVKICKFLSSPFVLILLYLVYGRCQA